MVKENIDQKLLTQSTESIKTSQSIQTLHTEVPQKKPTVRLNRIFILDTNVLIHDAQAIFAFKGVVVGIPFIVLEEIDTLKREVGEKGRNARESIRLLDHLRGLGKLREGVELDNTDGAILKVFPNPKEIDFSSFSRDLHDIKDNAILQTVKDLAAQGNHVTLVTKDINVRVKADALGLEAEDYTKGIVSYDVFYKGWTRLSVPANDLRSLNVKRLPELTKHLQLWPNQFIIVESDSNPYNVRLFRHLASGQHFQEVEDHSIMNSFKAKNIQQLMALDLLMDDRVKLVTLLGPAGTGKTFLTLLVGLYKVAYEHIYRKFLVTRPIVALGADIGFLPGDIQEKLHYWMQPVHDNLEFIFSQLSRGTEEQYNLSNRKEGKGQNHKKHSKHFEHEQPRGEVQNVERLQQKGILSLEAITYMRGRSIPFQFVFIDEVQNLTPHEVKTIVSRAGEGTKVILAGDPYQIDSPYLDFTSNGLTTTTEKMKDHSLFGTVFLETSERSELAKLAADVL